MFLDESGPTLSHHDNGGLRIGRGQSREHGRVNYSQIVHPVQLQLLIDAGFRIAAFAHLAGTSLMVLVARLHFDRTLPKIIRVPSAETLTLSLWFID